MEIEVPKKEQLEEVNAIAAQVHEMHVKWRPDIFVSVDEVIEKQRFEQLIENKEIYVIKEDEKIIGYVTISIKEKNTHGMHYRKILDIDGICIDENYRGKGAGTLLIKHIIDLGKREECTDLHLTVNEENSEAIKLYEKLGMKVKNISYSMKIQNQSYEIDKKLQRFIEETVFPEYSKNEQAHGIKHINYVIRRSFELIEQNKLNVDNNIVYVVAAYHDIGHHIDPKKHEIISAEIMSQEEKLKNFFSQDELILIKEAIEDHRASSDHEPRSIYGKIVSSADRNNTVEQCLERSYYYGKRLRPEATDRELYERAFEHLNLKFGVNGYAKFFLKDKEYEKFLYDIREILKDKERFCKMQEEHIKRLEAKEEQ